MIKTANRFPVWLALLLTVGLWVGGCSRTRPATDESGDRGEIEGTDTSFYLGNRPPEDTDSTRDTSPQGTVRDTSSNTPGDTDTGKPTVHSQDTDTHPSGGTEPDTASDTDTTPPDVQCNDYMPEAIFQWDGRIADLNVVGDTMVVALGREGIAVYDISGDTADMISRVETGGDAIALAMAPGYAVVLHTATGLSVVDLGDLRSPEVVGRTPFIEGSVALSLTGNIVSVLTTTGVALFDVTDPATPRTLGTVEIPDGVAIHAVDDTLYVGDVQGNIHAVRIADPMHPTMDKSAFITGGTVRALFAEDDRLYAANGDLLHVLDMDQPAATCVASKTDVRGSPYDLHVLDDTAYVLMNDATSITPDYNASWSVSVVDVSDPAAPTVLGDTYCRKTTQHNKLFGTDSDLYIFTENDVHTVPLEATGAYPVLSATPMGQNDCTPVGMTEALLFTFCNRLDSHADLTIFRTDGDDPEAIGTLTLPDTADMSVSEDFRYAYVLTQDAGLYVVDLSTPTQPTIVSMLELAEDAVMLTVSDGKAAVLMGDEDYPDKLWLLDLSDPSAPAVVRDDLLPPRWSAQSILLRDNLLYTSEKTDESDYQLTITDVVDLTTPVHMGSLPTTTWCDQLIVNDGTLFGLNPWQLFLFDVSLPGHPAEVSSLEVSTPESAGRRMGLYNDRLYVTGNTVVDVSNPAAPIVATYSPSDSLLHERSIFISDDRAAVSGYAAPSGYVIALYDLSDLSDPDQPETINEIVTLEATRDLDVFEETAYLLHPTSLESLDVSNPVEPTRLHRLALPFEALDMTRFDHMLYVAGVGWGLQIIDITSPTAPVLRGRVNISSVSRDGVGLTAEGTHVYMADNDSGLLVIDVADPDAPFVEVFEPEVSGTIWSIEKQGNTLYLASSNGLFVVDVTNPSAPTLLFQDDLNGFSRMIVVDHFIYMCNAANGIIYDVSVPASPVQVGTVPISYDRPVAGPLLRYEDVLLSPQHPIEILDISDPAAPFVAGHLPVSSTWRMVGTIAGDVAYFAAEDLVIMDLSRLSRPPRVAPILSLQAAKQVEWFDDKAAVLEIEALSLMDVSTPESPRELGRIPIRGDRLQVSDGLAFVSEDFAVHMIDIASASAPRLVGTLITDGLSDAHFIGKSGDTGYVIAEHVLLEAYDLSNMSTPRLIDTLEIPSINEGIVDDDRIYLAGYSVLIVVDISNADALRRVTTLEDLPPGNNFGLAIEGDTLAVSSPLMTFDITDPDAPVLQGQWPDYHFDSIFMRSGVASAVKGTYALTFLDVASQAPSPMIGQFRPPNGISDAAFDDNGYTYLVDPSGHLSIWDSRSFVFPPIRSRTLIEETVEDIAKQGETLFVLGDNGRVEMGDATTDAQGGFTEFRESGESGRDIALDGDLYVLDYEGLVRVFDVTDPAAPPVAETGFDMVSLPTQLLARDGLVVVLNRSGDIGIMERTPTGISVRSEHRLSVYSDREEFADRYVTSAVEIWDQKAVIVSSYGDERIGNLTVLDLNAPASPVELSSVDSHGLPTSIAMHGSYLFVGISTLESSPTGTASEILVWDLTAPSRPEMKSVIPIHEVTAMRTEGSRLIVAQLNDGVSVFDISNPTAPSRLIRIPIPSGATNVEVDDHRVFAVTSNKSLISFRVDDCVEWRESKSI